MFAAVGSGGMVVTHRRPHPFDLVGGHAAPDPGDEPDTVQEATVLEGHRITVQPVIFSESV